MAKAITGNLIEEECGLELGKVTNCGTGGAPFGEPRFTSSVVALKEVNHVGVMSSGLGAEVVKMAAQHCDELCHILE